MRVAHEGRSRRRATPDPTPGSRRVRANHDSSLLDAVLATTSDGILVVDVRGHIVSYNQTFARMWEIPEPVLDAGNDDDALNYILHQLVDPDGFVRKVRAIYASPDAASTDLIEFNDGRMFERFTTPHRAGRRVVGRIWSFRDLTTRLGTGIKINQAAFRTLFEHYPAPMWIYDVQTLRFLDVNNSAIRRFGYSRAEFLAMTILDTRSGVEPRHLEGVTGDAGAPAFDTRWRLLTASGDQVVVDISAQSIMFRGRSARVVVLHDMTGIVHAFDALRESEERYERSAIELAAAYDSTLDGWCRAMDLRDHETEGHCRRVAQQTVNLARELGVADDELIHIYRGALLHDIGKMGIADAILLKPGPLSGKDWVMMRKHPEYAHQMLQPIAYLRPALSIPASHHERWNGTGYPEGLSGEGIPYAARLFSVVDVWDALRHSRPYRAAWSKARALGYIREQSGRLFDPDITDVFLQLQA